MIQKLFSTYNQNTDNLYTNSDYWPLVLLSVAQGRIETARHLMNFHPLRNSAPFRSIDELLRSMPNFTVNRIFIRKFSVEINLLNYFLILSLMLI